MITYKKLPGALGLIDVRLDDKLVGQIRPETAPRGCPVSKVFRYWPHGALTAKNASDAHITLAGLKRSLEVE